MAIPLHFQPTIETVQSYAQDAIKMAREHFDIDLSSYDTSRLELIDYILWKWRSKGANVNDIGKTIFMFGSYAGEVLRNQKTGEWFVPDEATAADSGKFPFLAVKTTDGRIWDPINVIIDFMLDKNAPSLRQSLDEFLAGKQT